MHYPLLNVHDGVVMWRARVWENRRKGGQNVHVQLVVHIQRKRENEGRKGGIGFRVKSKREDR